jgi:hypothetical protein
MRSSKETCCAFDKAETLEEALFFYKTKEDLGVTIKKRAEEERRFCTGWENELMVIFRCEDHGKEQTEGERRFC